MPHALTESLSAIVDGVLYVAGLIGGATVAMMLPDTAAALASFGASSA